MRSERDHRDLHPRTKIDEAAGGAVVSLESDGLHIVLIATAWPQPAKPGAWCSLRRRSPTRPPTTRRRYATGVSNLCVNGAHTLRDDEHTGDALARGAGAGNGGHGSGRSEEGMDAANCRPPLFGLIAGGTGMQALNCGKRAVRNFSSGCTQVSANTRT